MTRTVADAAALLTAISGTDPKDGATAEANTKMQDYTKFLDKDGLKGKRIGVVRNQFGGRNDLASAVVEKALDVLRAQGAVLVDLPQLPGAGRYGATELEVLQFEFKAGVADYLTEYAPNSPIKSLADVMAFNEKNRDMVMPYFQQELIAQSVAKGGLDSKEYRDALANNLKFSREEGIDKALKDNKLDGLVAPSGSPSWLTDFIRGDFSGGGFSQAAAVAGYPHITVPAGFVEGLPVGISFVGGAWSEPTLFAMAYAYEQASNARRMPKFAKTVNQKG
jgi:amidase